jgi:hypothetical protein
MTVDQNVGAVKERCNVQSDDTTVSAEFVFTTIKDVRNELLRQDANKDQLWNGGNSQYKTGIELLRSTISEAKEFNANIVVYKSACPIPRLIDTKYGKIVLGVYFDTGGKIEATEYADWIATLKRRHRVPDGVFWFIRNEHLYVVDYPGESDYILVNMEGIFEDPELIESDDDLDYIGDLNFSLPGYLSRRVYDMAALIVRSKYGIPADTKNDGRENIQFTQQPSQ